MTTKPQIENADSPVKRELDRLELVERVPALQREAARTGRRVIDERGYPMPLLILPNHPAVIAYINECAAHPSGRQAVSDLRTARRNLKAAHINYKERVLYRTRHDIREWSDGGRFVSLSAIIEARADAMHWRKVINKLEAAEKMEQQRRWNAARLRVTPI